MKTILVGMFVAALILWVSVAGAQQVSSAHRCETCEKIMGKETPESSLSSDKDFREHGMFQVCQHCLDRKMDKQAQAAYTQLARKYKWNSIAHNTSERVKSSAADYRGYREMLARRKAGCLLAAK